MKRLVFIALILVFLDQLSKFYFETIGNYGAAFGILQGWKWFFILVSIFVLGFLYHYKDEVEGYGFYGLVLLSSGVIGNLIDRIFLGYVRDFINLGFWPSFNLADSYNTIGTALLIIYFWKGKA